MIRPDPSIFLSAMQAVDVDQFFAGYPPYVIDAKSDNEEPQNVPDAFNLVVLEIWKSSKDSRIPAAFVGGMLKLLTDDTDRNRSIYTACDWLWFYSYCLKNKSVNPQSAYAELFEVDMAPVAAELRRQLEREKEALIQDTRWAGAAWNSKAGLWEPLVRQALAVRDQLDGPDFVPRV